MKDVSYYMPTEQFCRMFKKSFNEASNKHQLASVSPLFDTSTACTDDHKMVLEVDGIPSRTILFGISRTMLYHEDWCEVIAVSIEHVSDAIEVST